MENLNNEQQKAVDVVNGPVLILAGAGTGKTKTLVAKISNIISSGYARPSEILAVTFTNRAAKEMNKRLSEQIGSVYMEWLGTFHSAAAKILRRHATLVGLGDDFVIIDADDQRKLVKSILPEGATKDFRKVLVSKIQAWKDKAYMPDNVISKGARDLECLGYYRSYQERLRSSNAVDFADLLLYNILIFKENSAVLEEYQKAIKYILVDEYQDTNFIQSLWLKLLAQKNRNLCCVGDDDQSIYGWRGADIENILTFSKDYPDAQIIRLERNYRSTPHILAVASSVIANNCSRLGKDLWTENNTGSRVHVMELYDGRDEAKCVTNIIANLSNSILLKDIAILVRAGSQTRLFEESFVKKCIPYQVIGNLRFYERKEIKDMIAYLRLIVNHNDNLAFERIINIPAREIGVVTVKKIYKESLMERISMLDVLRNMLLRGDLKRCKSHAEVFLSKFDTWTEQLKSMPLNDFMMTIAEDSGYIDMLKNDEEGRLENIRELVYALKSFEDPVEFLQHVSLITSIDSDEDQSMVKIMTLHMSKGLEFPCVFLPGWEEGVFPNKKSIDEYDEAEEERRLAYVGITRARNDLFILYAKNRFLNNTWQMMLPSRFVTELPKEHIKFTALSRMYFYSS